MGSYNKSYWDAYADKNEARYNEEFAKFVHNLVISLRCSSVLEIGCGTGIDLRYFPDTFNVVGVDLNDSALSIASDKMPSARFEKASITDLPFEDSFVDFVFTHQLLNYLDDADLDASISQMHRVSAKYIMSCEKYSSAEEQIDDYHQYRDIAKRWDEYDNVRIISNVDMHKDIEPDMVRFTLVAKL